MKLAIIGIVAVLLLGGGAAGAYFYFDKPAVASPGAMDETKKAEHEAKTEEAKAAAESTERYVQLTPLILPVMNDEGVTQVISLVVSIAVPDEAAEAEVKKLSPRLQDAFIQDMYGMLNRKNAIKDGVLQVSYVKNRLNKIGIKIIGKEKVKEVLIQVVQQRSL